MKYIVNRLNLSADEMTEIGELYIRNNTYAGGAQSSFSW